MKRQALSSVIIAAAVIWAVAAIAFGGLLLSGYELPFAAQKPVSAAPLPDGLNPPKARIDVIDVGQGSSLLVTLYGDNTKSILIDAGEQSESDSVIKAIKNAGLSSLDLIVITHPHTDHFGGAVDILEKYSVSELWMPNVPLELTPTNSTYQKFLEVLDKNSCNVKLKSKAETLSLDDNVRISILDGFVYRPDNLNDTSLCIRLDIGKASFVITGDGESAVENVLLDSNAPLDADILIAGHHGSGSSNGQRFLNAVTPIATVISVGRDNDYGHPDPTVYARLAEFGNVYRTDINGTVTLFTDGRKIAVSANNISDILDAGR